MKAGQIAVEMTGKDYREVSELHRRKDELMFFQKGDLVQHQHGDHTPYKIKRVMDDICLYQLYDKLGQVLLRREQDIEPWIPSDPIETWVSLNIERRWPHYKAWRAIAERKGITVLQLLDDYDSLEMIKRL